MPSKKKASEGIALLSMYADEDDEMEDLDEEEEQLQEEEIASLMSDSVSAKDMGDATDQPVSDAMNYAGNELESAETEYAVTVSVEEQKDIDSLKQFLPPAPKAKCSEELQKRIRKFITLKKEEGRSFNADIRKRKAYRNPDFLLHAVSYQDINQIGSCFSKDVFDPHGYDKSDFFDQLEIDMSLETERREQERKRSQKIDFASGGLHLQSVNVIPTPKLTMPNPGSNAIAAGRSSITPSNLGATGRDGRQNKKSKWDKV